MIKQLKAAVKQAITPVTELRLIDTQFTKRGSTYIMGDLKIRQVGDYFYYRTPEGHLKKLVSMFIVARLVYGKLKYGR